MSPENLTQSLKTEAKRIGFALAGVCAATAPPGWNRLREWLERGFAGEMEYFQRRGDAYSNPSKVLEGARTIVMLGMPYRTTEPRPVSSGSARVSRYAWSGVDYHDVIRRKSHRLADFLVRHRPEAHVRSVVDTAPLMERDFAALAGLGWQGKNTLVLNKSLGSWFFLAALLTDVDLDIDAPFAADHCGSCTACLDACPTSAFPQPYLLNATRCISYLTIEHRSPIPNDLRPFVGDWLFGCDVCQDVCPWNQKPAPSNDAIFQPNRAMDPIALAELFFLSDEDFRIRFRDTPLWRPRRRGILRNAAIVLGNQRQPSSGPALAQGLRDGEPLVRGACAWALARLGGDFATANLHSRLEIESDAYVRSEIGAALEHLAASKGSPTTTESTKPQV